jgi:hypothetical protein
LAALALLTSGALLDTAYMEQPTTRLFLVSFVYAVIIAAIILGASPYRLRDFLGWLYLKEIRPRIFGGIFVFYGILLIGVAFTY